MPVIIDGTNGITQAGEFNSDSSFGFKNRIINGGMVISQYNGTSSVTPSSDGYVIDRFKYEASQASKFTIQQNAGSVTPPAGFTSYLGFTTASAVTIGSSDYFQTVQIIEGLNIGDLGWGTANAKTVTLSFWVRSSLTGTFGGSLRNSAVNRSYPFSYTISAANTWEQKSITIAGDTSGTWLTTNGVGIRITFGLGNGSTFSGTAGAWAGANYQNATGATSVVGTSGATFYITGVQLEVGSTATSFDYRPYGTELALCQRYCEVVGNSGTGYAPRAFGGVSGDGGGASFLNFVVSKRATPTLTDIAFQYFNGSAWVSVSSLNAIGTYGAIAYINSESSNRLTRGSFLASAEL